MRTPVGFEATWTPSARPKRSKVRLVLYGVALLLLMSMVALGALWVHYPNQPGPAEGPHNAVKIMIPFHASHAVEGVVTALSEQRIIRHPAWFRLYLLQRGAVTRLKAGVYWFSAAMTPKQIADQLVQGVSGSDIVITIPEGKTMFDVIQLLAAEKVCPLESGLHLIRDAAFLKKLALPSGESLEGYLFPETYYLLPSLTCEVALTTMVQQYRKVWGKLKTKYPQAVRALAEQHKWGEHQVVTLASLIEKETAQEQERPLVASVFFNRLWLPTFVPHRLQSDPTIAYGCRAALKKSQACEAFDHRIHRLQIEDAANPYNTYRHEGLPPGPIANPGRTSLEAVLRPANTSYLYFVSRNDGTHQFSTHLAAHNTAVAAYQKNK